jgi:hypothetical protein
MTKHVVLINEDLHGLEFGMLRDFERQVIKSTEASTVTLPKISNRFALGTRYQRLRSFTPKQNLTINGEFIWCIMMGPENCTVDLMNIKSNSNAKRILYLFDTFAFQVSTIKHILGKFDYDYLITSFEDSKETLEKETGRRWYVVPQGVDPGRFAPARFSERLIGFCSYGRRHPKIHNALLKFSEDHNIHYDFTTWHTMRTDVDVNRLYHQYAWHLTHAMFSICYPVEQTNPARAGSLSPITCRWFECAASGTAIIGNTPKSPDFKKFFSDEFVNLLDFNLSENEIYDRLSYLWANRELMHKMAQQQRSESLTNWTWESRVKKILEFL